MPPRDDEAISNLKKHSAAQTLLQAGMLVELEAHRRELNRQSDLMEEGVMHAKLQAVRAQLERQELAAWRETLVEAEVAVRGAPLASLAELLRQEDAIAQAPEEASVEERRLAKNLLLSKTERYARLRAEAPAELDALEKWHASRAAGLADNLWKLGGAIDRATMQSFFLGTIVPAADVESAIRLLAEAKALSDGVFAEAGDRALELNAALAELTLDQQIVAVDHLPALKYALDYASDHLLLEKRKAVNDQWSTADTVLTLFTQYRGQLQAAEAAKEALTTEKLSAIEAFYQQIAPAMPEDAKLYAAMAGELATTLPAAKERRQRMDERAGCGIVLLLLIVGTIIAYFVYAANA